MSLELHQQEVLVEMSKGAKAIGLLNTLTQVMGVGTVLFGIFIARTGPVAGPSFYLLGPTPWWPELAGTIIFGVALVAFLSRASWSGLFRRLNSYVLWLGVAALYLAFGLTFAVTWLHWAYVLGGVGIGPTIYPLILHAMFAAIAWLIALWARIDA